MFLNIQIEFLAVGISIVAMTFLGFTVYLSEPNKIRNKIFLILVLSSSLWSIFNYLYNQPFSESIIIWLFRIHLFFAVVYTFFIFIFLYIWDNEEFLSSKLFKYLTFYIVILGILTLTPLVTKNIKELLPEGRVKDIEMGPGIVLFGVSTILLQFLSWVKFLVNTFKRQSSLQEIYLRIIIFIGISIFIILNITFNLIYPNVFKNPNYTKFGALFSFPFIFLSGYAILRYKLLNVRILVTEIFVFFILILSIIQILYGVSLAERLIRLIIFIILIIFSIQLIKSVRREVEQREKLEQLNRIKSEFLSFASHQVKAPMAVVKGYAELIIEGIDNVPEQAKDFAKKIKHSVDNLLLLIEEFMDYRKIEENKLEFDFEDVELINLTKNIINNLQLAAKEKNLQLTLETSFDQLIVKADKLRLSQVIQNLIDNAIKYTPQGWVKVYISKENNQALITVSDSGIGVSKELQTKLFGEFIRDANIKKEIRGTGLGLYIAKNIVEAHQGKIWVESEGEGKGSKFFVAIPLIN